MSTDQIPTPRTDALWEQFPTSRHIAACMAYFSLCRELERENAKFREALVSIRDGSCCLRVRARSIEMMTRAKFALGDDHNPSLSSTSATGRTEGK